MFKPRYLEIDLILGIGEALKPLLDSRINSIAKVSYEGGYNDCLCDIDDFLRRARGLPDLADRIWEIFADPIKRPKSSSDQDVLGQKKGE